MPGTAHIFRYGGLSGDPARTQPAYSMRLILYSSSMKNGLDAMGEMVTYIFTGFSPAGYGRHAQ